MEEGGGGGGREGVTDRSNSTVTTDSGSKLVCMGEQHSLPGDDNMINTSYPNEGPQTMSTMCQAVPNGLEMHS